MIFLLLILLLVPTAATIPIITIDWEEDRYICNYYGGYWKHNFCVYD